jgi:hypothetical protein
MGIHHPLEVLPGVVQFIELDVQQASAVEGIGNPILGREELRDPEKGLDGLLGTTLQDEDLREIELRVIRQGIVRVLSQEPLEGHASCAGGTVVELNHRSVV